MIKYFDVNTTKGDFRLFNLPLVEKIEQFGGQVFYKIKGVHSEKPLPHPNDSYLTLVGHLKSLDLQFLKNQFLDLKVSDENYLETMDVELNKYGKTIFGTDKRNQELNTLEFYDNLYITKINRV